VVETFRPATLAEALEIRARCGAVPFAGGTDLMVKHRGPAGSQPKMARPVLFLDRCTELAALADRGGTLEIGAMVTLAELAASALVHPVLREIVLQMAAPGLRNAATLGGNVCNASPAGDTLPFLYAFEAKARLVSRAGARVVAIEDLILSPGATRVRDDELLAAILVPAWQPDAAFYRKVGTRKANALAKVSIAGFADISEGRIVRARIALGAVAPTVMRLRGLEAALEGARRGDAARLAEAARSAAGEAVRPIDDQRSTAAYRRRVAAGLAGLFVEKSFSLLG